MNKKCKVCKRPKSIAYGQKYDKGNWCLGCDAAFAPVINKKHERQKAKREIREETNRINSTSEKE